MIVLDRNLFEIPVETSMGQKFCPPFLKEEKSIAPRSDRNEGVSALWEPVDGIKYEAAKNS